jgi:hypothetical protein
MQLSEVTGHGVVVIKAGWYRHAIFMQRGATGVCVGS